MRISESYGRSFGNLFQTCVPLRVTKRSTANVQLRLLLEMIYALLKTRPGDEVFPFFVCLLCCSVVFKIHVPRN